MSADPALDLGPPPGSATSWAALWRDLVATRARCSDEASRPAASGEVMPAASGEAPNGKSDPWASRARDYDDRVARRWSEPDSSRRFVLSHVTPDTTVLDIGAGTGAWSAVLAPRAARVTAIEHSPAMIRVLRDKLAARGIGNVTVLEGRWPEVATEPHDYSLCAHAMYWSPDLPAFVRAMNSRTRRLCFMVIRMPDPGGTMSRAAVRIWGHPYDSPNGSVAVNVLREMGLRPKCLVESGGFREPKTSASLEEARDRMKRHFGLCCTTEYDDYFDELLRGGLRGEDRHLEWPTVNRSALVYWTIE